VYGLPTENSTYIDQSKVVFIDWKLLWANVFFQSRGIGALEKKEGRNCLEYQDFKIKLWTASRQKLIFSFQLRLAKLTLSYQQASTEPVKIFAVLGSGAGLTWTLSKG